MSQRDDKIQYSASRINNRQLATLVDLCQGIMFDNKVTEGEVRGLRDWCIANNYTVTTIPIIATLQTRLDEVLADDVLNDEEIQDIAAILNQIAANPIATGELLTSASFPLDVPPPTIQWEGSTFIFTGTQQR